MREILFRGKLFRGKRIDNGQWVYGVPVIGITSGVFMVWIESETKRGHGELSLRDVVKQAEVIPETVGQYTGIKDKNGKRIFEGDIVRCCAGEYYQGTWEFDSNITIDDIRFLPEDLNYSDVIEIIGNIHEEVQE